MPPHEPDAFDVWAALQLAAADGDEKATQFLLTFEEWWLGQPVCEEEVRRFLARMSS